MCFNEDMPREEEKDIEIPGEDDENVGEGAPKKKREKRKKSKEERAAERKVVFWTLVVVLLITLGFWLMPTIRGWFSGEQVKIPSVNKTETKPEETKPENKNYMEITL